MPIAETDAGNLSAYDIGVSVSRVGGKTQAPALREATGTMRLDYAQFLELEMFSRFGGVPDPRVKAQLARGARLRTLLSQPQYAPLRLADEVALALALRNNMLDAVAPDKIAALRTALPAWLDEHAGPAVRAMTTSGKLGTEDDKLLTAALLTLAQRYQDQSP